MRIVKLFGPVIAALVVLSLGLGASSASAEDRPSITNDVTEAQIESFARHVAGYTESSVVIDGVGRNRLMKAARSRATVSGAAHLLAATAAIVSIAGSGPIVRFALGGDNVDPRSNLSVFFDSSRRVVSVAQITYTADGSGGGRADIWQDGTYVAGHQVTAEAADAAVSRILQGESNSLSSAARAAQPSWMTKFKSCLDRYGVPSWLIGVAAASCGISCAITAGVACVVCAVAVLGGFGTVGSTCAVWASTH